MPQSTTIHELFTYLIGNLDIDALSQSPPDCFLLAAVLAELSGSFLQITDAAFSTENLANDPGNTWGQHARRIGVDWARYASQFERTSPSSHHVVRLPDQVRRDLQTILQNSATQPIRAAANELNKPLLRIMGYADEACRGVGIAAQDFPDDRRPFLYALENRMLLGTASSSSTSLCKYVDTTKGIVMPKVLVPQTGLTLRSLSHSLAYIPPSHVISRWVPGINTQLVGKKSLNFLILPWPLQIVQDAFEPSQRSNAAQGSSNNYGFFSVRHRSFSGHLKCLDAQTMGSIQGAAQVESNDAKRNEWLNCIVAACQSARSKLGTIDGLIFLNARSTKMSTRFCTKR